MDPSRWPLERLSARWRRAKAFPHLVLDSFVDEARLAALRAACAKEPLVPQADELYQFQASTEPPASALLRAFAGELGGASVREALREITGLATSRVSLRAYRYQRGDYLLPHTDWREGEERRLAFAFYLGEEADGGTAGALRGGALQLYSCALEGGEIAQARVARTIAARPNRIAIFAVGPGALHRVCEVQRGDRWSLAGWFLA